MDKVLLAVSLLETLKQCVERERELIGKGDIEGLIASFFSREELIAGLAALEGSERPGLGSQEYLKMEQLLRGIIREDGENLRLLEEMKDRLFRELLSMLEEKALIKACELYDQHGSGGQGRPDARFIDREA